MNRRQFLKFNALSLASAGVAYGASMQNMHHTMSGMNANHNPTETSFIEFAPDNLKLLDEKDFPSGQDLQPLNLLKNESKKANFFRATLEVKENEIELIKGKKTKFYTYNNSIPAPKIEVFEGDTVEILVKNHLKEPTTIHWHGLSVPSDQDGNPQDPILAGRERIYRFKIPQNSAGTYWYHPHPHLISAKQVSMGLAGVFVIKAKEDVLSEFREKDLMISDLRLDENAQIPNNTLIDWLNGREGEFVLINGQYKPKIELSTKDRIRIYNLTSARYLNLRIQGAQFILVGTDGGLLEKPVKQKELFLNPASRVEVFIETEKGGEFKLESTYYDRKKMMVKEKPSTLFLANITLEKENLKLPSKLRTFQALEEPKDFKEITMSEMQMNHTMSKNEMKAALTSMFLINGKSYDLKRIDLHSKVDVVEDWIIINQSHMDHTFHIHGTQFELISSKKDGKVKKAEFRALRDTINVAPDEELRLRMKQDFSGVRMYHCHLLEHEDLGMMGNLEVME